MDNIEKALHEYNNTLRPTMEICNAYEISLGRLMRQIQLQGCNPRIQKAAELYKTGEYTLEKVGEMVGNTRTVLSRHFKKMGIEVTQPLRIYEYDDNFFEVIDNEIKAYWLGFIYADGSINENRFSKCLEIGLKISDIDHLAKFQKDLGYKEIHIQKRITRLNGKEYPSCRISVPNNKMCNDLIRHGATPRKSLTLTFPTHLRKDLIPHFIRGYFDGDGTISYRKKFDKWRISLLGTEAFLTGILNYFSQEHGVVNERYGGLTNQYFGGQVKIQDRKGNNAFSIEKSGNGMVKILNIMYGNATRYLDRKYELYQAAIDRCD